MSWKISFYDESVEAETLDFPPGILESLEYIFSLIESNGPAVGKPHTAPMGDGLFEIRAKGQEGIGRSLFCTMKGQEIVILLSFVKKTQKTPDRFLKLARKRMKEVKNA